MNWDAVVGNRLCDIADRLTEIRDLLKPKDAPSCGIPINLNGTPLPESEQDHSHYNDAPKPQSLTEAVDRFCDLHQWAEIDMNGAVSFCVVCGARTPNHPMHIKHKDGCTVIAFRAALDAQKQKDEAVGELVAALKENNSLLTIKHIGDIADDPVDSYSAEHIKLYVWPEQARRILAALDRIGGAK